MSALCPAFLTFTQNSLKNPVFVMENVPVCHSQHFVSQLCQICRPTCIVFLLVSVGVSIDFKHKTHFFATKISYIWTDRMLSAELETTEASSPQ